MRNAIITATDKNYLPAACCALLSCVRDGGAGAQSQLFLLALDVSASEAESANIFLRSKGASAEIIAIGANNFRSFRLDGYVSASTYSRLLLAEIFDDQWDRLLYVDADMRVMAPLQALFDGDLRGKPIGAVHDYLQYLIYGIGGSRTRLGLQSDAPYFNAGLICFDWRATARSGLLQKAKAFATDNPGLCQAHKAFEGAWTPLDPRWNFMTVAIPERVLRLKYPARFRPYISHFAGPVKPWMGDFPAYYEHHRIWYRDLLHDSPWPQFVEPANPSSGDVLMYSYTDRLRERLSTLHGRMRTALGRLSGEDIRAQSHRFATARKFSSTRASKDGDANPELEHLFDEMVEEAAGFQATIRC